MSDRESLDDQPQSKETAGRRAPRPFSLSLSLCVAVSLILRLFLSCVLGLAAAMPRRRRAERTKRARITSRTDIFFPRGLSPTSISLSFYSVSISLSLLLSAWCLGTSGATRRARARVKPGESRTSDRPPSRSIGRANATSRPPAPPPPCTASILLSLATRRSEEVSYRDEPPRERVHAHTRLSASSWPVLSSARCDETIIAIFQRHPGSKMAGCVRPRG